MANFLFISQRTKLSLFLNTSFLFLFCFYLTLHLSPSNSHFLQSKIPSTTITPSLILEGSNDDNCSDIHKYQDHKAKCLYVSSNKGCKSEGYIDYLQLFYCICGRCPILGYTILTLWLIVLFYLLGNTAANYFCSSLENLSKILKLSPTIAGVTLLSLGNGAPDVFSSIVSFMGNGSDGVGFNSILGGAFFVSSIVVGIICICISPRKISVDKSSFIRDIIFFLLSLFCLLVMVIVGRINIWGAMGFVSLYFIYVLVVSTTQFWWKNDREVNLLVTSSPLPITKKNFPYAPMDLDQLGTPLLCYIRDEKPILIEKGSIEDGDDQKSRRNCFGSDFNSSSCDYFVRFLYILELPLSLPRRLTIPVVCEEKWSKPFAVISVTLAPILLTFLWRGDMVSKASLLIYLASVLVGILCGIIAFVTTKMSNPPKRFLLPWLVGGFLMSVTWSYIIAEELVALLVSLGSIFGINPSILGLTLLAWGNSIGDLIANIAMAMNGEQDGAQIAISGSYAGPIFNILLGLGFPLVLSCWSEYPSSYVIPRDPSLYETIGFLMAGLLWALVILPRRKMMLDRVLGGGLLAIYLCFLSVRLAQTLGAVPLQNSLVFFKP